MCNHQGSNTVIWVESGGGMGGWAQGHFMSLFDYIII